jgi:hypothetical protein
MTPSGIEPAAFRFVTQYLNHCATAIPLLVAAVVVAKWNERKEEDFRMVAVVI